MSIGEEQPSFGQSVDVRRLRLRMATQWADPVIEIVDPDEQDIRLIRCMALQARAEE